MIRSFKVIITLLAILLILPPPTIADQLRVVRVTDGDTIKAEAIDGMEIIIRLVGIDTPEKSRKKNVY
jgi:endonuclease YncB( thermonuclease family)